MTNFEEIKSMSKDTFAEWLDELCAYNEAPWITWFDRKYCNRCEPIKGSFEGSDMTHNFAYCECHDDCKYFPYEDMCIPANIIKEWLEQEVEEL